MAYKLTCVQIQLHKTKRETKFHLSTFYLTSAKYSNFYSVPFKKKKKIPVAIHSISRINSGPSPHILKTQAHWLTEQGPESYSAQIQIPPLPPTSYMILGNLFNLTGLGLGFLICKTRIIRAPRWGCWGRHETVRVNGWAKSLPHNKEVINISCY